MGNSITNLSESSSNPSSPNSFTHPTTPTRYPTPTSTTMSDSKSNLEAKSTEKSQNPNLENFVNSQNQEKIGEKDTLLDEKEPLLKESETNVGDGPVDKASRVQAGSEEGANPDKENLEKDTILEEEGEEEEEGECGFCLFMKGGGCKDTFIEWEKCIEEGEKNKEDIVEKCFQVTSNLKKCMEEHSEYYAPILQAEKAAEAEAVKELEKEKEKEEKGNEGSEAGSVEVEAKSEESSSSS